MNVVVRGHLEFRKLNVKWLPIKGIQNVRQTCYFNSTLQLLSACNSLVSKLYNVHPTPDMGCIIEITSIWLKWLDHPSPLYIELEKQRIVRLMGQLGSPMIYGAQEDAHECLLNLFRLITNDLALSSDAKKRVFSRSRLRWYRVKGRHVLIATYRESSKCPDSKYLM